MKRVQFVMVLSVLFGLGILNASGESITLETLKNWAIVTAPDAIESEKYAADEFQEFFKLATGVSLEKTDKTPEDRGYIFIGQSKEVTTDDLGEEGLRIVISPNSIIITGGRPRGALYGAYEFFERYLNVQFLTADHTYVPENINTVKIPCETYSYITPFKFRWPYIWEVWKPKLATRMRTNTFQTDSKFGGNCGYGLINHSFHKLLPAEKYGKEHPEYFMMQNGVRAVDYKDGWGYGPNPCYASQGALEVVAQSAMDYFKNNPDKKNVSLSCVDSHDYCQCPKCLKMNELHGGTSGSHFDFINRAARIISEKYPDKMVGSLAYHHTRHAPTNMQMKDNVQIQLCSIECCRYHALDDPNCPLNVPFYKDMKDWSKICKNIMIWYYNVNFGRYDMPLANLKCIGPSVRFFRDNNVKGVFMQGAGDSGNSSMSDLKIWVISQCLWKPGSDSWDLALKFCKMHYAESAGPIIEWLSFLHNRIGLYDVGRSKGRHTGLSSEMGIKAFELFQEAMNLAKSDEVRRRVEKASICVYRLILEKSPYARVGDTYKLVLPEGYENVLDTYKSLVKKYNTHRPRESGAYAEYYKGLEDRKIVAIENDVWKIELFPEWNAKLFNLVYKPENLKLLKCRLYKDSVRDVWEERAVKGIKSEIRRDYVITYQIASKTSDSVTLSAVLADGSKIQRKIWLDKDNPEKICSKTQFTHNGDEPKEYQFEVISQFHYEGLSENDDSISTLVSDNDKWVDLNKLIGGKLAEKNYVPLNDNTQGGFVIFNKRDSFGLKIDYSNLVIKHPHKWWEYYIPRMLTNAARLEKGQSMSWKYSLTPTREKFVK